ncbi:uncharacterized protein NFIA_021720 [Aspergillus fischeri NRRL 181]|uniref:DUF7729 domain-containing protein n=1 Tax=Neosartorya fischeri (strain ATCC 1020 / DSM 3700 / CBS 544.65 / FGSC A1164 / JCM 1740 / NRRL 181 / WB 181) TaxID=331117 RepID=A1D4X0_NEOFI|nr:conserved hypothetical protein [Aspergillus fischeri NRRL 181]EAW23463.1 conserved hypothetical protein [Aspergillus fischeri NRRL 181]
MKSFLHPSPYRPSRPSQWGETMGPDVCSTSRHHQSGNSKRTSRFSTLITLLMVLLLSSLVSAAAIPDDSRPLTHGVFSSRTGASPSGQSVTGDHLDSGQSRYGKIWVIESSLADEAATLPILVAAEEDVDEHTSSHLHARYDPSTDSLPTPFDTNLSSNFTAESCPKFFNDFLSNSTVTSCYPISLLLHDSTSFFHTLTSATATSHVLDLSCAASVDTCTSIFNRLATNLLKDDACGKDYKLGNPLVANAYTGFITYEPVYRAACLKNPATNDYCFVDAATNASSPQNLDTYSIPAGYPTDEAPWPTCNECLQASMDIFSRWAQVDGQPLTASYLPSALALNRHCGDNFANVNITVGEKAKTTSGAWKPAAVDWRLVGWTGALSLGMSLL